MEPDQGKSQLRQAGLQIVSGGFAGFVEICLMHPLDIAKTRLQMQVTGSASNQYKGVGDCFAKMYRQEGLFSYWKGILPPILVETPKTAVRFFTFEQSKRFFLFGESKPTPLVIMFGHLRFSSINHFSLCPRHIPWRDSWLEQWKHFWSIPLRSLKSLCRPTNQSESKFFYGTYY